jgi:arabinoxylan arabinofuranohydrolase
MRSSTFLILLLSSICQLSLAENPIIPSKGVNDPHIRIFDGKAWLSATHDKSIDNKTFIMEDWWLWSSDDLVNWKLEHTFKPEDTYIGQSFQGCWATDIVKRNGKYYWYFSERNEQSGVMVADSPTGPWTDPLGKPLLTEDLTPTHEYDMGIFEDGSGDFYIVFGVWDYYIAKLNEDMISLAEKPRKITISNPRGPYNPDGQNTEKPTDDKPFLHSYKGKYYLSWGCFYAMADNVYGPYEYTGSIVEKESFAPGYEEPTWPNGFKQGRHGSFFQWHNQWYFAYCDISQTGNRYFRDTFISYVHYRENGEMALIRVDGTGVGGYDADEGPIEAEDYFKASEVIKNESGEDGFKVGEINDGDYLVYNNVSGLENKSIIQIKASDVGNATIELRENDPVGKVLAIYSLSEENNKCPDEFEFDLPALKNIQNLCFVFKGEGKNLLEFDAFSFR